MPKSYYLKKKITNHIYGVELFTPPQPPFYINFHNTDPGVTGLDSVELLSDRLEVDFLVSEDTLTKRVIATNTAEVVFGPLSSGESLTASHITIWDSVEDGELLYYLELENTLNVNEFQTLVIPVGALVTEEV